MNYNPPTYDKKWVDNFVGCKIDAKCEHICCYVQTFYLLQSLGLKPPILAFSHFHFQFVDTLIESFVGTSKSLWWSIQVTVLTSVESTCHVLVLGTFWISHTSLVLVVGPLWNITTSREEHCTISCYAGEGIAVGAFCPQFTGCKAQQCLPLHLGTNLVLFSAIRLIFGWYEPGNLSGTETGRKLV
jgi:hypothetical protein